MAAKLDLVAMYTFAAIALLLMVVVYFLPAILASKRRDTPSIQRLNLWLGWTGIGWIAALIWAFRSPKQEVGVLLDSRPPSGPATAANHSSRFDHQKYSMREGVKLVGKVFHIYSPNGDEILFADMKAFKLREDIRLYAGEDRQTEVLLIKAREIFDVSATYDVVDPIAKETVGAVKRQGLRSLFRDEWVVLDTQGQPLVVIKEDRLLLALLRRLLVSLVPQRYVGTMHGRAVCVFKEQWNPFVRNLSVDFADDINRTLDHRLGIAAAVLLCAVEGKEH